MIKKLALLALTFTMTFSFPSFAEWKRVTESVNGETAFYVDFERIRKHGGYVYYWRLSDYLKPEKNGDSSNKTYQQGDCKLFRWKRLDASYHTQPMGEGTPSVRGVALGQVWNYPPPDSSSEIILKSVCAYAK